MYTRGDFNRDKYLTYQPLQFNNNKSNKLPLIFDVATYKWTEKKIFILWSNLSINNDINLLQYILLLYLTSFFFII